MHDKQLIFIAGVHSSGTTMLHRIIGSSPDVSMLNGPSLYNEGQHLQSLISTAADHGGRGRFALDAQARLTEADIKANSHQILLQDWSPYWDLSKPVLVEKSPPNILRTRYLQGLFPGAKFITILRHPVAVSLATHRRSQANLKIIFANWIRAHQVYHQDTSHLDRALTCYYEDMVSRPAWFIRQLEEFCRIRIINPPPIIDHNQKYFEHWKAQGILNLPKRIHHRFLIHRYETQITNFGYSMVNLKLQPGPTVSERSK